jgi:hypothetical protein
MLRVICKECGGVVELPVEKLPFFFENPKCRFCPQDFAGGSHDNPFKDLQKVVSTFKSPHFRAEVEFVFPDLSDAPTPKK